MRSPWCRASTSIASTPGSARRRARSLSSSEFTDIAVFPRGEATRRVTWHMTKSESIHCDICGHRAESVFCSLAGMHLDQLDRDKQVYQFRPGQALYYEQHPSTAVYCVYEGRVKVYKVGRRNEEIVIRLLGPGDTTGFRAMLADEPYAATAEAIDNCTVCAITKDTITGLLRSSPDLAIRFLGQLANELRVSEEQMVSIAQQSVLQRTARLLIWLQETAGGKAEDGVHFHVPLLRKELALMIGATPESLSRTLQSLQARNLIELTRSTIAIKDRSRLIRLAGSPDKT
ncbi:MAG: cyclic nucleotide-binding domain-containing protein [candidate division Zixibacteria bacterium]|nr:cyclic nucleotide-binding domain-containing protein [candidate division Zixibacteria bacterium]